MTKWISVKDSMPEHEDKVLCKFKYKQEFYAVCIKYGSCFVIDLPNRIKLHTEDHKKLIFTKDVVTHWMPLPKPPERKETQ